MKQVKASVWERIKSSIYDVILAILIAILFLALFWILKMNIADLKALSFIIPIIHILYDFYFIYYQNGATLGMKVAKIKVVSEESDLTFNQVALRTLSYFFIPYLLNYGLAQWIGNQSYISLTFFIVQFLIIVIDQKNRGYQDLIAKTWVVKAGKTS